MKHSILIFILISVFAINAHAELLSPVAYPDTEKVYNFNFVESNPLTVSKGDCTKVTEEPKIIGNWDFENGKSDGLTPQGGVFNVENGVCTQSSTDSVISKLLLNQSPENYILDFDFMPTSGAPTVIVYVGMNGNDFYSFECSYSGSFLRKNGTENIITSDCKISEGEKYHLNIVVSSGKFTATLNDNKIAESDEGLIPKGNIAIGTWASSCAFDNIILKQLSANGFDTKLHATSVDEFEAYYDCDLENLRLSSNIKAESFVNGEVGIFLRDSYYFSADGKNVYIKLKAGGNESTLSSAPYRIKSGEFFLISARAEGSKLTLSINNNDILSAYSDIYTSGKIGIYKNKTYAVFNDLVAEEINSEKITTQMSDTEHKCAYEILTNFGIMDFGKIRPQDKVTRLNFAEYICKLLKLTECKTNKFTDTDSVYANTVSEFNIMNGTGGGAFGGEKEITATDAAKVLIDITGYKKDAELSGGYPNGYQKTAVSLGLLDGIENEYLTGADCAIMIMRAGELSRYESDTRKNKLSIFEENYSLKTVKGTAKSNNTDTNLSISDSQLLIDDILIDTKDNSLEGRYVKCYYTENFDVNRMVYIYKTKCDEIVINADELEKCTDKYAVKYYKNNKQKTKSLKDSTKVIYNGKYLCNVNDNIFTADMLNIENGDITIIDNNSKESDYIFINNCTVILVSRISAKSGEIEDRMTGNIFDAKSDAIKIYTKSGASASLSDISVNDILRIYKSGYDTFIKYSKGNTLCGEIKSLTEEEIQIDNDIYKRYTNIGNTQDAKVGKTANVYLDENHKVLYIESINSEDYGYLSECIYSADGDEPSVLIKMFSFEKGAVKAFAADSVMFCNYNTSSKQEKIKDAEKLYSQIKDYTGIIRYEIKDDKITKLYLPKKAYSDDPKNGDVFTCNFSMQDCQQIFSTFYSRYKITDNTKILLVPSDPTVLEDFSFTARDKLYDDEVYTVRIYDCNEKYEASVVAVSKEPVFYNKRVGTVKSALRSSNKEGDNLYGVTVYTNGGFKDIYAKSDMSCNKDAAYSFGTTEMKISDLKPGDIISYHLDSNGYIKDFITVFQYDPSKEYYRTAIKGWATQMIPHTELAMGYANVTRVFNDRFFIKMYYGTVNCTPRTSNAFCIYDKSTKSLVSGGTIDDLKDGDDVVCIWNNSSLNDIIIYR